MKASSAQPVSKIFFVRVAISTVGRLGCLWDCSSVSLLLGTIMLDGPAILGHASIN